MLALAIGSLSVTIIIGIYFISIYGSIILAIGLLGIIVIVLYTPYLTKLTGITELAGPGTGVRTNGFRHLCDTNGGL